MRLSSKRLNVTRLGAGPAAEVRSAALISLGSASPDIISCYASCYPGHDLLRKPASALQEHAAAAMIAPTARRCKRVECRDPDFGRCNVRLRTQNARHGIVSGITMMPY